MHMSASQNEGPKSPTSESSTVATETLHSGTLPRSQQSTQSQLQVLEIGNLPI